MNNIISLQLYTLRDLMSNDWQSTLKNVAEIGYKGIELAGFPADAQTFKSFLDSVNLTVTGAHIGIDQIENEYNNIISFAKTVGFDNIIIPYYVEEQRNTKEACLRSAQRINELGKKLKNDGLNLLYHNHDFEFKEVEDTTFFEVLYNNTDKEYLNFEFDLFWVTYSGQDALEFVKKHQDRTSIIHVKDMNAETRKFTEVGTGIIDYKSIIDYMKDKVKIFVVEQDMCFTLPPIESVTVSYNNLSKMF